MIDTQVHRKEQTPSGFEVTYADPGNRPVRVEISDYSTKYDLKQMNDIIEIDASEPFEIQLPPFPSIDYYRDTIPSLQSPFPGTLLRVPTFPETNGE